MFAYNQPPIGQDGRWAPTSFFEALWAKEAPSQVMTIKQKEREKELPHQIIKLLDARWHFPHDFSRSAIEFRDSHGLSFLL